jgi:glycine/D-amino acid oxidase-like deaminating enzyme
MQPQTDTTVPDRDEHRYQRQIPWWHGLDPAIRAELEILPVQALSLWTSDVVIIGGGVTGLSAALSGRAAGAEVLVLEREAVLGYGATGRNAGILSAGINMSFADLPPNSPDAAFWPETTRLLLSLVEEAGRPGSILFARLTSDQPRGKLASCWESGSRGPYSGSSWLKGRPVDTSTGNRSNARSPEREIGC